MFYLEFISRKLLLDLRALSAFHVRCRTRWSLSLSAFPFSPHISFSIVRCFTVPLFPCIVEYTLCIHLYPSTSIYLRPFLLYVCVRKISFSLVRVLVRATGESPLCMSQQMYDHLPWQLRYKIPHHRIPHRTTLVPHSRTATFLHLSNIF